MKSQQKPVIFIVGATASGKSEWALRLAQEFHGVIVNCDSVQVYKKLNIGTAKPTIEEQALVPHYLLDYVSPPEEMTAGLYSQDFYEFMGQVPAGKPIFVVGGTGFYFQAIEKGMYPVLPIPEDIQRKVAQELHSEEGTKLLYQELQERDPEYGKKIHLSDRYRIGRAIELMRSHGKSVTQIQEEFKEQSTPFPYPLLKMGLAWEREVLRERIDKRTEKMLQSGLIEEVQGLLDEGLAEWLPMSSVGYKETVAYLQGHITQENLHEEISVHTRQLAKRQKTWFQRDKEIHWLPGTDGYLRARALVEKFLNS